MARAQIVAAMVHWEEARPGAAGRRSGTVVVVMLNPSGHGGRK